MRHPRHGHGAAGLPRHAGAGDEHPRPAGQGAEGRADRARLRPDDLRRELHGAGQGLPRRRDRAHAASRRQFGRPLADLELIKKKIAYLAATAYAMEATTYQTAALIDRGAEDYMLETAILKVFSTEALWQGVYETLQVFGGQGYFSDEPYERMMRDARINTIGEGANEVLKAFIALVGMRDVGEGLKTTLEGLKKPGTFLPTLWKLQRATTSVGWCRRPRPGRHRRCSGRWPTALARRVARFGRTVERLLIANREAILDRQYIQERIADAAIALVHFGVHPFAMGPFAGARLCDLA